MIHSKNPWKNLIWNMMDGITLQVSVGELKKMIAEPRCVVCKKELEKTGVCSHDCAKMLTRQLLVTNSKAVSDAIREYNAYLKDVAETSPKSRRKK